MRADVAACREQRGEEVLDVGFHQVEVNDHRRGVERVKAGTGGGTIHLEIPQWMKIVGNE